MKIELNLPEISGYEYTGEYRAPNIGEHFLKGSKAVTACDDFVSLFPILRKIKPPREFKDGAFYPFILNGDLCIGKYCPDLNRFDEIHIDEGGISWIGEEIKIDWGK